MEKSKEVELLPCPFCGSEAILETEVAWPDVYVICKSCLNCTNHYDHWIKAYEAWNTRSTPKSQPKEFSGYIKKDESLKFYASFEFIEEWFVKANKTALNQGRTDSARLWQDGLEHLRYYKDLSDKSLAQIRELREALDDIRAGMYPPEVINQIDKLSVAEWRDLAICWLQKRAEQALKDSEET